MDNDEPNLSLREWKSFFWHNPFNTGVAGCLLSLVVVAISTVTAISFSRFIPEVVIDWGADWLVAGPGLLAGLVAYRWAAPVCYRIWVRRNHG